MDKIKEDLTISGKLDVPVTDFLTKLLLKRVANEEIEFNMEVRHGSIDVEFSVGFSEDFNSSLIASIIWEIAKSIWRRMKKERRENAREPHPITIFSEKYNLEGEIRGDETVKQMRDRFRRLF